MAVIQIDIVSDVICPWCYIGYRALQRAISLYQKTYPGGSRDQIEISWKPYFIDQTPPAQSELINDRMIRRMQDHKAVRAAQTRLQRAGTGVGLQLKFGGYMGSSREAHRLLHIVREEKGRKTQSRLSEGLFHLQFERECDVSERAVLVAAAELAGLRAAEVQGWLEEAERGRSETELEEGEMRAEGVVQGVPHFVIGGRHLEGAVDVGELMEAMIRVTENDSGEILD